MSDNGRRYTPKDATPRSQNSREFKLNLSEDQLNHTDELEDLQGYAGSRAPLHSVWKKALPLCTLAHAGTQSEKGSEGAQEKKPCKGQKKQAHFRVHVALPWLFLVSLTSLRLPDRHRRLQRFSRCRPYDSKWVTIPERRRSS